MLLVVTSDEFQIVPQLLRQVERVAFDFNVWLSLLGALNFDKVGAALLVIGTFFMDLVPKSVFGCELGHRKLVSLIDF